jgi:hypothetical protein
MEHAYFLGIVTRLLEMVSLADDHDVPASEQQFILKGEKPFTYESATAFLLDFCRMSCVSLISLVGSLVYVSRAVKSRQIRFHPTTWRLVWTTAVTLSEKFWEDNYVAPSHLRGTLQRFNVDLSSTGFLELQQTLFRILKWQLDIPPEEFHPLMTGLLGRVDPRVQALLPVQACFTPRPLPKPPVIDFASPASSSTTASDRDRHTHARTLKTVSQGHQPIVQLVPSVRPPSKQAGYQPSFQPGYHLTQPGQRARGPSPGRTGPTGYPTQARDTARKMGQPGHGLTRDSSLTDVGYAANPAYPSARSYTRGVRGTTSPVPPPPGIRDQRESLLTREVLARELPVRELPRDLGRESVLRRPYAPPSAAPVFAWSNTSGPRLYAGM